MFLNIMSFSVYSKIKIINLFSFFFLMYFLSYPLYSQNNDNSGILNSNEQIKAEYGNWLQICENEKNQCVGVQFALDVQGERAARFIIERINQNTETVADSLITIFVPYEANVPILPNGITLAVDSAEPFTEQFSSYHFTQFSDILVHLFLSQFSTTFLNSSSLFILK